MRERSMGERFRLGNSNAWELENKDVVSTVDEAVKILTSNDAEREKAIKATADFLAVQPLDLLDLWAEDKRLGDYLRTKKDLEGYMNDLRSAMDLARVSKSKKPKNLSENDAQKIVSIGIGRLTSDDLSEENDSTEVKNSPGKSAERYHGSKKFIDSVVKLQSWDDFVNTLAAVNRKKEFFNNDDFNLLRKNRPQDQKFDDFHQTLIRKLLGKLEKGNEVEEFIGLYGAEYDKKR